MNSCPNIPWYGAGYLFNRMYFLYCSHTLPFSSYEKDSLTDIKK